MNSESLRQLIRNCRSPKSRALGFPRDWSPTSISYPDLPGAYFTHADAWDLIANLLESGHPYEEIQLDDPPGAPALVLKTKLANSNSEIYIKLQIGKGCTPIGRSFHYSERYSKHEHH